MTMVVPSLFNSLSGASIHADAKTVSIPFFPNSSSYVSPTLSALFTDELRERFASRTKLEVISSGFEEGDLHIEGEIVNTSATPTAVTASSDYPASQMRLTVTVRVRFRNKLEPNLNFERTFAQYSDYSSDITIQAAEGEHLPIIVKALVDDIFNATVQNW